MLPISHIAVNSLAFNLAFEIWFMNSRSSILDVLEHHGGKLVVRNLTIAVLINLLNDLLNDFFVEVLPK